MKTLLIGERYRDALEYALLQHDFAPVWLPDHPLLDPRLAGHADLSVFWDYRLLVAAAHLIEDTYFVKQLTNIGTQPVMAQRQGPVYPADASLCCAVIGGRLYHKPEATDPTILQSYAGQLVPIRQAYARCMVCTLGQNTVITADHGISAAAKALGADVLEIPSGGFALEGFAEGFLGGSTFTDDKARIVYFTGKPSDDGLFHRIEAFLKSKGYRAELLTDRPAFDIGSAILL